MGELLQTFTFDRNTLKSNSMRSADTAEQHIRLVDERSKLSKAQSNVIAALRGYTGLFDFGGNASPVASAFLRIYVQNKQEAWRWLITRSLWLHVVPNGLAANVNTKARRLGMSFTFFKQIVGLLMHLSALPGNQRFLRYEELLGVLDDDDNWALDSGELFSLVCHHRYSDGSSLPSRILLGDLEDEFGIGRDNFNTLLNKAFAQTGLFEYQGLAQGGPGFGGIALSTYMHSALQRRVRFILDSDLHYGGSSYSAWMEFLINPPSELPIERRLLPKQTESFRPLDC